MTLNDLYKATAELKATDKMPVLFVGHGSPMNAIEENEFTKGWSEAAGSLPKPAAILVISAHWETKGTQVTINENPPTIHDFGGFPEPLYEVQYPAPGSPSLAAEVIDTVQKAKVLPSDKWGLDHGTWSVIKHFYPEADVPVVQLSIDHFISPRQHYELAKELAVLRRKGVLIIGSGNMVHNLGMVSWRRLNEPGFGFDWALETDSKIKNFILQNDHDSLINYNTLGKGFDLAIPTPEHYIPLLYTLGLKENNDEVLFFNEKAVGGSLTMTSVKLS